MLRALYDNGTPRVCQVAAMHRLVQGQHKEALPIGSELPLPSLGRREGGLVEVSLAQRLQNVQVPSTQVVSRWSDRHPDVPVGNEKSME